MASLPPGLFFFLLAITIEGIVGQAFGYVARLLLQAYCVSSGFYSLVYAAISNGRCSLLSQSLIETLCTESFPELDQVIGQTNPTRAEEPCCVRSCRRNDYCALHDEYLEVNFDNDIYGKGLWLDSLGLLLHSAIGTLILFALETRDLHLHYKSGILGMSRRASARKGLKSVDDAVSLRQALLQNREDSIQNPLNLYVSCLTKRIGKREILSRVSLVAEPGEVLLILGPEGSGKTFLLDALTQFVYPTKGDVYYNSLSLYSAKESRSITPMIGYCPSNVRKFSENISGFQFLKLFGRLRGIPGGQLDAHVLKWLTLLRLEQRAGDIIQTYSIGMRRKLLIASALIGDPPILLFDVPTEDLNPISKSQFWKIIRYLSEECRRIIIIAEKSTDELIEKNCNKLGILINGEIEKLMTISDFKSEFGQGFSVIFRLKPDNIDFEDYSSLKSQIEVELPESVLQVEAQDYQKYFVPKKNISWSGIFTTLETIKTKNEKVIQEYTVQETTLEDIYQSFAIKQTEYMPTETMWDQFCFQYC